MFKVLILLSVLLFSGCATTGDNILHGSGIPTEAPAGWSLHCSEQPKPVECGQ